MTVTELQRELIQIAHRLRPVGKPLASVVGVAYELGTAVWLRLHTSRSSPSAQIDFANRPAKILLYRSGKVNGEREIRPSEDALLTVRERFSIAHELGHWMAFTHFRVGPTADTRKYWEQERAINAFAGCLLVPDWLVGNWLAQVPEGEPVPASALTRWANWQCSVSEDVITKALVRRRRSIGFLKLWFSQNKDRSDVLEVLSSASGDGLRLPVHGSHIQTSELFDLLKSDSGSASFRMLGIAQSELHDVRISWYRTAPVKPTWVSLATLTGGPGVRPSECEACGASLANATAVLDSGMPYSIFCSSECRDAAIMATDDSRPFSLMFPKSFPSFDD